MINSLILTDAPENRAFISRELEHFYGEVRNFWPLLMNVTKNPVRSILDKAPLKKACIITHHGLRTLISTVS